MSKTDEQHSSATHNDHPAINVKYQYNKEDMLQIYSSNPLSKQRPEYLPTDFDQVVSQEGNVVTKLWKPDLWIQKLWEKEMQESSSNVHSVNSCSSSNVDSTNGLKPGHRYVVQKNGGKGSVAENLTSNKRLDRLKTDSQDAIVLSPQRRSFVGGCQAPANAATAAAAAAAAVGKTSATVAAVGGGASNRRSSSPTSNIGARFKAAAPIRNRVIGPTSGAGGGGISLRSENWRDRQLKMQKDNDARTTQPSRRWVNSGGGDRSVSSTTSSYTNSVSAVNCRGGGAYRGRDTLPEWATDGPLDVHDTIDLHGFDDDTDESSAVDFGLFAPSMAEEPKDSVAPLWCPGRQNLQPPVADNILLNGSVPCDILLNETPSGSRFCKFFAGAQSNVEQAPAAQASVVHTSNNVDVGSVASSTAQQRPGSAAAGEKHSTPQALLHDAAATPQRSPSILQPPTSSATSLQHQSTTVTSNMQIPPRDYAGLNSTQGRQSPMPKVQTGAMNLEDLEAILCNQPAPKTTTTTFDSLLSPATLSHNVHNTGPTKSVGKQVLLQEIFKSVATGSCFDQKVKVGVEPPVNDTLSATADGLMVPPSLTSSIPLSSRPSKPIGTAAKGKTLADPDQQQHLLDVLTRLHAQQMHADQDGLTLTPSADMGQALSGHPPLPAHMTTDGLTAAVPNPMTSGFSFINPGAQLPPHFLATSSQAAAAATFNALLAQQNALLQRATPSSMVGPLRPATVPGPTPQELLLNAQLAYQKALFNRKLEVQLDQHMAKKQPPSDSLQIGAGDASAYSAPTAKSSSNNFSAFTPTSVLRQMHGAGASSLSSLKPSNATAADGIVLKDDQSSNSQMQEMFTGGRQTTGRLSSMQQPASAAAATASADLMRLMQHQQRQHLLRVQQQQQHMHLVQQMGGAAALLPRLGGTAPKFADAEYQQMMAMALLHQQQQQQHMRSVAGMDFIRQRALLAAAMQQPNPSTSAAAAAATISMLQQQRPQMFRPPCLPVASVAAAQQQHEMNVRLRSMLGFDGSSSGAFPTLAAASSAVGPPATQLMTLEELERLQKAAVVGAASTSANA